MNWKIIIWALAGIGAIKTYEYLKDEFDLDEILDTNNDPDSSVNSSQDEPEEMAQNLGDIFESTSLQAITDTPFKEGGHNDE